MSERNVPLREADQWDWNGVRDKVVELTARGKGPKYIAKLLGVSEHTVANLKKSEFRDRNASRQEIIEACFHTLNWLHQKLADRIEKAGDKFSRQDIAELRAIISDIRKMMGADSPTQHEIQIIDDDITEAQLIVQLVAAGKLPASALPQALPEPTPPQQVEEAEYQVADVEQQRRPESTTGEGA